MRRGRYDLEEYVVHQGMVAEDVFPGINLTNFFRDFGLEDLFGDQSVLCQAMDVVL